LRRRRRILFLAHHDVLTRIARGQENQKRQKLNGLHARKSTATARHRRHLILRNLRKECPRRIDAGSSTLPET
jgi:hypothetical protein